MTLYNVLALMILNKLVKRFNAGTMESWSIGAME